MLTYLSVHQKKFYGGQGGFVPWQKILSLDAELALGNKRSHALNSSRRSWKANLQKVRIMVDGKPKRVWVSARALKSGKVTRV